jgi:peptide subunit release factor 1 (eRF1)
MASTKKMQQRAKAAKAAVKSATKSLQGIAVDEANGVVNIRGDVMREMTAKALGYVPSESEFRALMAAAQIKSFFA